MSHHKRRVPSYCLHKRSGRAVVRLNGKDHYLGKYGSEDSHTEYQRLIKAWLSSNKRFVNKKSEKLKLANPAASVGDVLLLYQEFAKGYYVMNGEPKFLFSPRDAEAHRNELRRANRKSPMTPSQRKRKAKKKPKRAKRERYDTDMRRVGFDIGD